MKGFARIVFLFLLCGVIGNMIEILFVYVTTGEITNRSSVIYGPFSLVWGFGGVVVTCLLKGVRDKNALVIFGLGCVIGGAYEYISAVITESVLGTYFWDYSGFPLNVHGRINAQFCLFWGMASLIWIRWVYPVVDAMFLRLMAHFSEKLVACLTIAVIGLMILDIVISALAIRRYVKRKEDAPVANFMDSFCDRVYGDDLIDGIYPYMGMKR